MQLNRRVITLVKRAFYMQGVAVPQYTGNTDLEGIEQEYPEGAKLEPRTIQFNAVQDALGVPVFDSFTLRYQDTVLDLVTVMVDVTQSKNIVKTSIVGVEGTIKEYISKGDYSITIRGVLINEQKQYPFEQLSVLQKLCAIDRAIEVDSDFLQLFGVFNLVIEEYNISRQTEDVNTQIYELTCSSDTPIELIIE